jgi:hypothetical protein
LSPADRARLAALLMEQHQGPAEAGSSAKVNATPSDAPDAR